MGRATSFPQADALEINQIRLEEFLGVDYSDNATSLVRARNMRNMVRNNEILSMRFPIKYESDTSFEGKINGIYEWTILKGNIDSVVLHSGTNIIILTNQATRVPDKIVIENVLSDKESMATVLDNKLVIFDGVKPYILYQDEESATGFSHAYLYDYDSLYAPATSIARAPDGTTNTWYQAPNRINNYRQNWFYTIADDSKSAISLLLDDTIYEADNSKFKVEQMDRLGNWIDVTTHSTVKGSNTIDVTYTMNYDPIWNNVLNEVDNYTYISLERLSKIENKDAANVAFSLSEDYTVVFDVPLASSTNYSEFKYFFSFDGAESNYTLINISPIVENNLLIGLRFRDIGLPPIRGTDNIKVTFAVDMTSFREEIDTCNIVTKYGYQANMNRIFVSGNILNPNVVLWCDANNPTYWPEDHWTKVGESAVLGFTHTRDGSLLIHKRKQTDNITTYYMKSDLAVLIDKYERTVEIFPIVSAVGDFELVNRYMTDTYLNDPCFLTNNGVYCVSSTSSATDTNDERFSDERSYYIRQRIPEFIDNSPKRLVQFGKYLFMFNDRSFYVADKTHASYSPERILQYEWYPCDSALFGGEIDTHLITSVNVCWNTLYIGDDKGILYKYDVNSLDFYDGDYRYLPGVDIKAITCEWESQYISAGIIDYKKTLTNIYVNYLPFAYHNRFDVNVITVDENRHLHEEWYNVEDNLGNPFVEDFAEYNKFSRDWYGDMSYKYNRTKTFRIRQRTKNVDECILKISNKSYDNISLSSSLQTYTTHMSLRSIVLDVTLGRKVR